VYIAPVAEGFRRLEKPHTFPHAQEVLLTQRYEELLALLQKLVFKAHAKTLL
jgi:hypothetical protein